MLKKYIDRSSQIANIAVAATCLGKKKVDGETTKKWKCTSKSFQELLSPCLPSISKII